MKTKRSKLLFSCTLLSCLMLAGCSDKEPVRQSPTENVPSSSFAAQTVPETTQPSSTEYTPKHNISSVGGITYIDGVIIANKTYSLPEDYNPGVNPEAADAFYALQKAGKADGLEFWIASGFRSYNHQAGLYTSYCNRDGQAAADTYSARPGHSEHQTGLAFDCNIVDDSFAGTPEANWLEKNCYKYGFIIRYPKGKEYITGYQYEPWHIRYLGVELATKVYNSGLTLEEYFEITSVYSN